MSCINGLIDLEVLAQSNHDGSVDQLHLESPVSGGEFFGAPRTIESYLTSHFEITLGFPVVLAIMSFVIRTPCSSANIGPGFDVIGLALSLHLELHVTVDSKPSSQLPLNCAVTYEDQSKSVESISLDPEVNLITRVALYVLRCHGQHAFPVETKVHIINPIPLGRGLGSSGTAVVAGVMLGNEVGKLGLSKERLLDYCLMIGRCCPSRSARGPAQETQAIAAHRGLRPHMELT